MKLYGYRRCSTCRDAQRTLEQGGATVEFIDIVQQPPSVETIRRWLALTNRPIIDFVNTRGTVYRERDLAHANLTEEQWVQALTHDGKLLKRPIVVSPANDVLIGYDVETYQRLAQSSGIE